MVINCKQLLDQLMKNQLLKKISKSLNLFHFYIVPYLHLLFLNFLDEMSVLVAVQNRMCR